MFLLSLSVIMLYSTGHTKWSHESNTICVKTSLHLNTFINQFQIRFKIRFTTKNTNAERVCHLFSRCRHSHYRCVQNISFIKSKCFLWYWVDCLSLKQANVHFESLTIVVDDVIVFLTQRPRGTCRKSSQHTFWIVNTMERRMLEKRLQ